MYYTYTYAYRYMHIYMSICIHIHMHMWFSSETERCICAYLYIFVFIHIGIFVYIYTYAFTCAWSYVCLYLLRHVTLFPQDSFQLWHRVHVCKYVCVWCVWLRLIVCVCVCVCNCQHTQTCLHTGLMKIHTCIHEYMHKCIYALPPQDRFSVRADIGLAGPCAPPPPPPPASVYMRADWGRLWGGLFCLNVYVYICVYLY